MDIEQPSPRQQPYSLFDSHCHLDFTDFDRDRTEILKLCADHKINHICIPSTQKTQWKRTLALASHHFQPQCHIALGLHPYFIANHQHSHLEALDQQLSKKKQGLIAVGEIGLDFSSPFLSEQKSEQALLFDEQLRIAAHHNLPVIIHARKSHDVILKKLRALKLNRGGIVHAYSGSEQQARQYIDLGFKLGFGGGVTYERAKKTRQLAANLPLASMVLETDAPDMPLSGFQGQRNSPCQLTLVLKVITELRQESICDIAIQTTRNAKTIFGIA